MKEVTLSFPSGGSASVPYGSRVIEVVDKLKPFAHPLAAVLLNNEICSVYSRIEMNARLEPVTIESPGGALVYRRSLCYLLAIAVREAFPERRLVVGHSLGSGYYYTFDDDAFVGTREITTLSNGMNSLVKQDLPILCRYMAYAEALEQFTKNHQPDTALLLRYRNDAKVPVNECRGFVDLSIGPLVPRTGILTRFELKPYRDGFLLRFPAIGEPETIPAFTDEPLLFSVYSEYKRWGKVLRASSVGQLNEATAGKKAKDFIQIAEALQAKKVSEIADRVAQARDTVKVILIAGPSSSGKTTFSKKLALQLKVFGREPINISLDDYFVDREHTPRDETGAYDFEALEALDVELLNANLLALFAGEEIELPSFDFKTATRKPSGKRISMGERSVLVIEGIHGLNDALTPKVDRELKFKIYVSALTQLNLDDHNRIPTTDNRLLRRMVRDYQFRGHGAKDTLAMWPSVQRGERMHIFPFQNSADVAFNSALDYELSILKIYAEPLLKTVKPFDPEYAEASRLLSFLENFAPIPSSYVPNQSIVREFIGDSDFKY
jgi:uridine kinase